MPRRSRSAPARPCSTAADHPERQLVAQPIDRLEVAQVRGRLALDDRLSSELDRHPRRGDERRDLGRELVRGHVVENVRARRDHRIERGAYLGVGVGFDRHLPRRDARGRDDSIVDGRRPAPSAPGPPDDQPRTAKRSIRSASDECDHVGRERVLVAIAVGIALAVAGTVDRDEPNAGSRRDAVVGVPGEPAVGTAVEVHDRRARRVADVVVRQPATVGKRDGAGGSRDQSLRSRPLMSALGRAFASRPRAIASSFVGSSTGICGRAAMPALGDAEHPTGRLEHPAGDAGRLRSTPATCATGAIHRGDIISLSSSDA